MPYLHRFFTLVDHTSPVQRLRSFPRRLCIHHLLHLTTSSNPINYLSHPDKDRHSRPPHGRSRSCVRYKVYFILHFIVYFPPVLPLLSAIGAGFSPPDPYIFLVSPRSPPFPSHLFPHIHLWHFRRLYFFHSIARIVTGTYRYSVSHSTFESNPPVDA